MSYTDPYLNRKSRNGALSSKAIHCSLEKFGFQPDGQKSDSVPPELQELFEEEPDIRLIRARLAEWGIDTSSVKRHVSRLARDFPFKEK